MHFIKLLLLLFIVSCKLASAQNISRIEYFFNNDPGIGQGTAITGFIPAPDVSISDYAISMASLPEGLHQLYVRSMSDNGVWSITQVVKLYRFKIRTTPDIVQIEYFIDTDPGFGNGTGLGVSGSDINQLVNINLTGISPGLHFLYIRVKDNANQWSITKTQAFVTTSRMLLPADITDIEWFVDTDPGFGNASQASGFVPGTQVNHTFPITFGDLEAGMHTLYIRTKDKNDNWSITQVQPFVIMPEPLLPADITDMEWFIDTDPGFGNASPAPGFTPGTQISQAFPITFSNLNEGMHLLYVRVKDKNDNWSITQIQPFVIMPEPLLPADITDMEWFIDTDPGFGNASPAPGFTPGTQISQAFPITFSNLNEGMHLLYVRVKDKNDNWSITQIQPFVIMPELLPADITDMEWFIGTDPGFGNASPAPGFTPGTQISQAFPITFSNLNEGMHLLYVRVKDKNDNWSITQIQPFVIMPELLPADITDMEWFIDVDPGFGNANPAPGFAANTSVNRIFPITLDDQDEGLHILYIRCKDADNDWSITQQKSFIMVSSNHRVPPDIVSVEYFIDKDPGFGNGVTFSTSPATTNFNARDVIPTENLAQGIHILYMRAIDAEDNWSITQTKSFIVVDMSAYKASKIMALEYFIDQDPGFGAAQSVNISPTTENASRRWSVAVDHLPEGAHLLYVRALNENQQWSITQTMLFVKIGATDIQDIVSLEYFIDTDPGFGNAYTVPVSPGGSINKLFEADVTGLTENDHILYVRALDKKGNWAITQTIEFKAVDDTGVIIEKPEGGSISPNQNTICQGSVIPVTLVAQNYDEIIDGWEHRLLDMNANVIRDWSHIPASEGLTTLTVNPNIPGIWQYQLRVLKGTNPVPEYSQPANIIVIPAPVGGFVTANAPEFVCLGSMFTLTLEDHIGRVIKWQERNTALTSTWTDIAATTDVINVSPNTGGTWEYRAEVMQIGCPDSDFSAILEVKVVSPETGGIIEPDGIFTCIGKQFELHVKDQFGDVIKWQSSVNEGATWADIHRPGETLTATHHIAGKTLYRAVSNSGTCGQTYSEVAVVFTDIEIPAVAGGISGETQICIPATGIRYSVTPIPYIHSYEWTLPVGASFDGDNDKEEVWVDFAVPGSGQITVRGTSPYCAPGVTSVIDITLNKKPETPVITGPSEVCIGEQATYSVPMVSGATYTWTLPVGWTGTSTDNSITVTPNGISGTIQVTITESHPATVCTSEAGSLDIMISPIRDTGPLYRIPNMYK